LAQALPYRLTRYLYRVAAQRNAVDKVLRQRIRPYTRGVRQDGTQRGAVAGKPNHCFDVLHRQAIKWHGYA